MKIAIIGATRGIGRETALAALADSHEVTVLARTPGRMSISDPGLHIISGDDLDPDAIAKVVAVQDVV